MIPTGVPDKAKIAIYAAAPPWPTDEYKTEPINNKKAVNELAIKYSIIKFPFKQRLVKYLLVGAVRFELTTPCTPCKYATRLRYAPNK